MGGRFTYQDTMPKKTVTYLNTNEKHWDSAYLHQGMTYQSRDPYPDP